MKARKEFHKHVYVGAADQFKDIDVRMRFAKEIHEAMGRRPLV